MTVIIELLRYSELTRFRPMNAWLTKVAPAVKLFPSKCREVASMGIRAGTSVWSLPEHSMTLADQVESW